MATLDRPGTDPAVADDGRTDGTAALGENPNRTSPHSGRLDVWILALVVLVALAIRVVYVLQSRDNPLFDHPILDGELHDRWARAFAEGRTLFDGPYFRAPLYPWFLGVIYALAGPGYLLPRMVQVVIGSFSCGLLYLIGKQAFGRVAGVIAGLAAATYWVSIYYEGELLLEPLSVFLNLLWVWLFLWAARTGRAAFWGASGIVLGLSALNRPNVLVFMPLAAAWIVVMLRPRWRRGLGHAAIFGLGCVLPVLPVTVRNYVVGGDWVLIAWQGGPSFYIGNNPQSDGWTPMILGARRDWWGAYHDWIALAEQEEGRKLKPSEVSRFYARKAWQFIREQPKTALALTQRKFLYFWNDGEIPNPTNLYFFSERYAPIVRFLPLSFGMIAPPALVGLWFSRRKLLTQFPLWGFAAVYMVTVVVFFMASRFRLPVVPFLMLYAGYAVVHVARALRRREWSVAGLAAVAIAVLWPVINTGLPPDYRADAGSYCYVATSLGSRGQTTEAMEEYAKALAVKPTFAPAYSGMGEIRLQQGRFAEAIKCFERALELNPKTAVHDLISTALVRDGRYREAVNKLREGIKTTPGNLELQRRLAWLLATCPESHIRSGAEAVELAERVVRFGGPAPETLDTLAAAYAEVGRFDEAVRTAEAALAATEKRGGVQAANLKGRLRLYQQGEPYHEPAILERVGSGSP